MSWRGLSVFGLLLLTVAAMMAAPAFVAATTGARAMASVFAMSGVITAVAAGLLLLATYRRTGRADTRAEFGALIGAFALIPLAAAAPVAILTPYLTFEAVYFEMVSMMTTTGATVFEEVAELHPALNLWRGLIAWLGGLVALIMAYALLAPRNLGGFEVRGELGRSGAIGRLKGEALWAGGREREVAADRVASAIRDVLPIYGGLTAALAIFLILVGMAPLNAFIAAIGVMSTSGVQAVDEPAFAAAGLGAEVVAAGFLILAATRHTYGGGGQRPFRFDRLPHDPEMRILLVVTVGVALWLFMRHFVGVLELTEGADRTRDAVDEGATVLTAIWGALFTALSFATTTGFLSNEWDAAQTWSGLDNPSMILMGLAMMGGGIATTAGGVKLLRAYALFRHGTREMERLVRPSSISGSGARKRGLRREGAQIAWVFVMLFLVSLAAVMLALSLTGLAFENTIAAAIAALSNTGPLYTAVTDSEGGWLTTVTREGRAVLVVAMVLGRVELLALIAMMSSDRWR